MNHNLDYHPKAYRSITCERGHIHTVSVHLPAPTECWCSAEIQQLRFKRRHSPLPLLATFLPPQFGV